MNRDIEPWAASPPLSRRWKFAWALTGLVALLLLAATVALGGRARALQTPSVSATLTSPGTPIYLRAGPGASGRILTFLTDGAPVRITSATTVQQVTWYLVEAGDQQGWVPASNVRLEPP